VSLILTVKARAIAAAAIMAGVFAAYGQIAERYPGDNGIETDPAVILADDFESYTSPEQMMAVKWSGVNTKYTRITTEFGNVFAGSRSLEFTPPISSSEIGQMAWKLLNPTRDQVFFRTYLKFDLGFDIQAGTHNGIKLSLGNIRTAPE
jgi:hypothetical protein